MAVLTKSERDAGLAALTGWAFDADRNALSRRFVFADFSAAFGFMARVALAAEKADHHPDWSNLWNRVDISLSTHDAGGVTAKDIALAKAIDAIGAQLALGGGAH